VGARAQTASPTPSPQPSSSPSLEKNFFKNILRDQKAIWTSPAHVHGHDAPWLFMLGMTAGGFMATDRATGDDMATHTGQLDASRIISYAGSIYGVSAAAGSFYLIGRATHNERARETGILATEAIIDSGIVVTALKEITQRARPLTGKDRSKFFVGGNSFPSGHSIEAWSVATVVAHEYHGQLGVQIAAYGIASAVSVSRFTGLHHYLSDILVGSAMGYGIGRYVYHAHHRDNSKSSGGDHEEDETFSRSKRLPVIAPMYNRRAHDYGVALAWSF
jgi:hypothetical protein